MGKIVDIISIDSLDNCLDKNLQDALLNPDFENKFDYKSCIQPNLLRRMSPIIKRGVGAAIELAKNNKSIAIEGIIVGTGMGCVNDSVKFIDLYKNKEDGLVSPTSFIQSTHNTIAGQIGLLESNHSYNMTFVQNGLSFEVSQIDATLQNLDNKSVLLGTSDEKHHILEDFAKLHNLNPELLDEGATFMLMSPDSGLVSMEMSQCFRMPEKQTNLDFASLTAKQLVLYGRSDLNNSPLDLSKSIAIRYDQYCGRYFTNSAFGIHLAFDIIMNGNKLTERQDFDEIVVLNNYQDKKFGKTILRKS